MPETFLSLEQAANLEGITYNAFVQRLKRNPTALETKRTAPDEGGRERVEVALSSLSVKAHKAYRAAQRIDAAALAPKTGSEPPWYVEADLNQYITAHEREYHQMTALAGRVREYLTYGDGPGRTAYAAEMAQELGVSARTLYRYAELVSEATAWALRRERETGYSYDYYAVLALCRKPKEANTFPSLTEEQKALVQNIWYAKDFAKNQGTVEMLYEAFELEANKRGWAEWPSIKTVRRYVKYLDEHGGESVRYLASKGTRVFKNEKMLKCKRDTTYLQVMEVVQADAHTFDCWVQVTQPNGKIKAVRPMLVAFIDVRSRRILGDVMGEVSNMQTIKQAFCKMSYQDAGGVPRRVMLDNGKDFTGRDMTGQARTERECAELVKEYEGFYRAMGVEGWHRSRPYEPWDKAYIERSFGTVCQRFTRWMGSYTGTLTGSRTDAKVNKDVPKLLERGQLLTMEEFYEKWTAWKTSVYEQREHRGLKDAGEKWVTPITLFENGERYQKAPPAVEFAAVLLMKSDTARVTSQGIRRWNTWYKAYELGPHIDHTVSIKWDPNDITRLHVYDLKTGAKICEAPSAELLKFTPDQCDEKALQEHIRNQKRQLAAVREAQRYYTTPYELREAGENATPAVVGSLDLTLHGKGKAVALLQNKAARAEVQAAAKSKAAGNEYIIAKAQEAMRRLQDIG